MVVAEPMEKPTLKVSVSDSESSDEESDQSAEKSDQSADESDHSAEELEQSAQESDQSDVSDNELPSAGEESDADVESEDSNEDHEGVLISNEGWADSVAKILSSNKPKNKKTLVLSRAKKHSDIVKTVKVEKPSFEIIGDGEIKEEKPIVKTEETDGEPPVKKVKQEKPSIRVKPNILEKDRERLLTKIATKGVVQLFNAVRNQQKSLEKEIDRKELTEGKKDKILKKFDKRTFLDTLMGNSKSIIVDEHTKQLKDDVKDEEKPKWNALRDDFMMGAKMKDWDKESVDE